MVQWTTTSVYSACCMCTKHTENRVKSFLRQKKVLQDWYFVWLTTGAKDESNGVMEQIKKLSRGVHAGLKSKSDVLRLQVLLYIVCLSSLGRDETGD